MTHEWCVFPGMLSLARQNYPPSVILNEAKIPICHPCVQRRILIGIFAESKFCRAECPQADKERRKTASATHGSAQRDLQTVFDMLSAEDTFDCNQ